MIPPSGRIALSRFVQAQFTYLQIVMDAVPSHGAVRLPKKVIRAFCNLLACYQEAAPVIHESPESVLFGRQKERLLERLQSLSESGPLKYRDTVTYEDCLHLTIMEEPTSGKLKRLPKQPTRMDYAAYRLVNETGLTQNRAAEAMARNLKRPFSQSAVSRAIARVNAWNAAQGMAPVSHLRERRPIPIDPRKLDMGPRRH
jgi:hypothetical protein